MEIKIPKGGEIKQESSEFPYCKKIDEKSSTRREKHVRSKFINPSRAGRNHVPFLI